MGIGDWGLGIYQWVCMYVWMDVWMYVRMHVYRYPTMVRLKLTLVFSWNFPKNPYSSYHSTFGFPPLFRDCWFHQTYQVTGDHRRYWASHNTDQFQMGFSFGDSIYQSVTTRLFENGAKYSQSYIIFSEITIFHASIRSFHHS